VSRQLTSRNKREGKFLPGAGRPCRTGPICGNAYFDGKLICTVRSIRFNLQPEQPSGIGDIYCTIP
jgi:hypothetical protein